MAKHTAQTSLDSTVDGSPTDRGTWSARFGRLLRSRAALGAGLAMVAATALALTYWLVRPPAEPEPPEALAQALAALDAGQFDVARRMAARLAEQSYRDPGFPGATSFILGMVAWQQARQAAEPHAQRLYQQAITSLDDADAQTVTPQRRPQWALAMGESLAAAGQVERAVPLLEEAVATFPAGRIQAAVVLVEVVAERRLAPMTASALDLATRLLTGDAVDEAARQRLMLARATLLHLLNRPEEAFAQLADLPNPEMSEQAAAMLRAHSAIDRGAPRDALPWLESIVRDRGAATPFTAPAAYLLGRCALDLDEPENALDHFSLARDAAASTADANAALLGQATAFRRLGRREEAFDAYLQVLRAAAEVRGSHGRWITPAQMRRAVLEAVEAWISAGAHSEAVALCDAMAALGTDQQAAELASRAAQEQAQLAERQLRAAPPGERAALVEQARAAWRASALRQAALAEHSADVAAHRQCLATSAEQFARAGDFAKAIEQYDRLIGEPRAGDLCLALVRRAQCHAALDALPRALADLRAAIAADPADPLVFEARYLLGHYALETNDPDAAEQAWRGLLESPGLTPSAVEWRRAMFALGRLLYDRSQGAMVVPAPGAAGDQQNAAAAQLDECAARMHEFLTRYPGSDQADEAEYLLAASLRRRAELFGRGLAGPDVARPGLPPADEARRLLPRALRHFMALAARLSAREADAPLNARESAMLTSALYGIADCHFLLDRHDEAIRGYSVAAGRAQRPADALPACLQISRCYARLGQLDRAAQTLAQAGLLLRQLPEETPAAEPAALTRAEWQEWLAWALQLTADRSGREAP